MLARVAAIRRAASETHQDVQVAAARADPTVSEDREQLVEQVLEAFGRIDMLVNAATGKPGAVEDLLEMTQDAYQDSMDAGVTATLFLTQLVANEMVRLVEAALVENPKIVTINSISAYTTSADHGPHCISRAVTQPCWPAALHTHSQSPASLRPSGSSTSPCVRRPITS